MYNFYPGPSRIYPAVQGYAMEAFESGILEKNHRSADFMELLKDCIALLKDRMNIPASYKVFFTSSATECWEICAQSFLQDSIFYFNGAFGEKWQMYTHRITGRTRARAFGLQELPAPLLAGHSDVCLVANETSNGTALSPEVIREMRAAGAGLLVVDAVSSFGGVDYRISDADIWVACSQKCLGLPSGMGIMVLSPLAQARARELGDRRYYNSALFVEENFDRFQTPYTPNILAIYLLKRLLENTENVSLSAERIRRRAAEIYRFLETLPYCHALIESAAVRSSTVVAVGCPRVDSLTKYLAAHQVVVGKGYGAWRDSTFRMANFPAISDADFSGLFGLLRNFSD